MQVRPMDQMERDCFSGAMRGPLGQTPAIGISGEPHYKGDPETGYVVVVVDRDGVQAFFMTKEGDDQMTWAWTGTFAAGLAIAKALVEPLQQVQLEALGFTQIN